MVTEVNDQNFDTEVLKSTTPVVVDFWAPWCGPCRMLGPVMDKLSESYSGKVKFVKLNVDDNRKTASKYGVMSIPTVIYMKSGVKKDSTVGALPENAIRAKVDGLLNG
jgi:thioredoxin 1